MRPATSHPVFLFVGGGTLGSVTPLLAVIEELRACDPHVSCAWWGTARGPERALVEAAGTPFTAIPSGKLRRYWDLRTISDAIVIAWAFCIAFVRLAQLRPSAVVGAGSFVQVPVMWAAALLRIPVAIHQLDVRPGLANRLVASFARSITATFPGTRFRSRSVEVIGTPVRRGILTARDEDLQLAKRFFGFSGDRPCVFVLGGGTGAAAINALVVQVLPELIEVADIIHVTGRGKVGGGEHAHERTHARGRYCAFELLTDDLASAYAAADLVIARAGMGTIAELAALGKASVLIPMPGTHQEENAHAFAQRGAAVIWNQLTLTPDAFIRGTRAVLERTNAGRHAYRKPLNRAHSSDAAVRFATIIRELAE